jgi:hypothetical protein
MNFDRVFTTCPYLSGSSEGAVCSASALLLRNMEDINADMCMSRHFEVCRIYIEKLRELDILGIGMKGIKSLICNTNLIIPS